MRIPRRLAAALVAVALAAGYPAAHAQDSAAVAVNTRDGFDLFKLAFSVRRAATNVVDNGNAAVAYASCTDCQTIALAIQVVLVFSDPDVVTPENLALAINVECTLCDTLASAYQFVLTTDGPVHFTADGQRRLLEIRKALAALADAGLTGPEIQAKVAALMAELREVLATELVAAGNSGTTGPGDEPTAASASPTATGGEEPDAYSSLSPSPSASAEPSPSESTSPSATASPEPTP